MSPVKPELVLRSLALCVVIASASTLLVGCGGGEMGESGDGNEAVIQRCDESGSCVNAPANCEKSSSCVEKECAAESGGCEPIVNVIQRDEVLFMCFDLRVTEAEGTGAGETTETVPPADTTDTGETVEPEVTAECPGVSFPVRGVELEAVADNVKTSSDGRVMWSEEKIRLVGEIVDGVFQVTDEP